MKDNSIIIKRKNKIKKSKLLLVLPILLVLICLISSSYALFIKSKESDNINVIKVGDLSLVVNNLSEGNSLNLASIYPISDEEGLNSKSYQFSVENTGTLNLNYTVKIVYDEEEINRDNCSNNLIDSSYLKYKLDDFDINVLGTKKEDNNYILYKGTLNSYEANTHEIRIWLSKESPNSVIGKHFHAKIVIDIEQANNNDPYNGPDLLKYDFKYTGDYQIYIVPKTGTYRVELWGSGATTSNGYGRGGYTAGNIELEENTKLYVYVGGQNSTFNGGGEGGIISNTNYTYCDSPNKTGNSGTDIRLIGGNWDNFDGLKSRIMVAGAGGENRNNYLGDHIGVDTVIGDIASGGGLYGYNSHYGENEEYNNVTTGGSFGTQTFGGAGGEILRNTNNYIDNAEAGSFGKGGKGGSGNLLHEDYCAFSGYGGSSGYYGSGGAAGNISGYWTSSSTAGASSFISGHDGCDAIDGELSIDEDHIVHTGQSNHYSGYVFTETSMIDGAGCTWTTEKEECNGQIQPDGTTTNGHAGNGYARITYLGE